MRMLLGMSFQMQKEVLTPARHTQVRGAWYQGGVGNYQLVIVVDDSGHL